MTTYSEIPLSSKPQTLTVSLGGTTYQLTVKWNAVSSCWVLDIADSTGAGIVSGIPMITGADLLGQYAYLGISGALYCQTDNDPSAVPTFSNLGTTGHLYLATD
ncbi:phage baseplate plug family protein [Robbsia andropogonis]|uniref:phage baseplate plug family protein n=1 Tax=Robbsia andropogonis TaxID=28092 RepID=UPI003F4F80FD